MVTRYSDVIEPLEPIIFAVIANFRTNIAHFKARQRLMSVQISHLNHKGLHPVVFPIGFKLSIDDTEVRHLAHISRPILSGCKSRTVYHKLVCLIIKSGSCL